MKKSELKQIIGSALREILAEKDSENEKILNMKIKNPDTGEDIKLKSALSYKKDTQVYKAAKAAHDKAVDIIADKPKKKTAKKKVAPAKGKWSAEQEKSFSDWEKKKNKYDFSPDTESDPGPAPDGYDKWEDEKLAPIRTAYQNAQKAADDEYEKTKDSFSKGKPNQFGYTKQDYDKMRQEKKDYDEKRMSYDRQVRIDAAKNKPKWMDDIFSTLPDDHPAAEDFERYDDEMKEKEKAEREEREAEKERREAEKRAEQKRQEAEKEKAKRDLHGNDWHDSKAEPLSAFDSKVGGASYADMMKKSHSEIDKGNITKDTLPPYKAKVNWSKHSEFARREYDRIVDKAWEKDKEATRDSLINRIYDVNDSPEAKELMKKIKSGEAEREDEWKLEDMTSTGLDDIEYMKDKVGEKNLMFHMKRIKKEREYEKKSGIGKFFSKLGLNEEDIKNPPKLKDLIRR